MPGRVVDASAVAALLFGEPEAGAIAERLGDERLVAPSVLSYEVASVCRKKAARHPEMRESLLAALGLLARLGIGEVAMAPEVLTKLALDADLSVYDAGYLHLALERDADLVTLDRRLAQAWTRARSK